MARGGEKNVKAKMKIAKAILLSAFATYIIQHLQLKISQDAFL